MTVTIAWIIFIISFGGILFILLRKIPVLVELPKNGGGNFFKEEFILKIEEKIKKIYSLFSKQIILHKVLSWVKCLTLKIETKIDFLLHQIRKQAKEDKLNGKK